MREKTLKIIAEEFGLSLEDAGRIYDNVFKAMSEAFLKGKNLNIPEFGKFILRYKKTAEGRKVKTIKFSPVKKIAREVNKNYDELTSVVIKKILSLQAGITTAEKFNYQDKSYSQDVPADILPAAEDEAGITLNIEELDDNELETLIQPEDLNDFGYQEERPPEPPAEELRIPANLKELHEEISAPAIPGMEIIEEARDPGSIFTGEKSEDNSLKLSPVENNEKIKSFNDVFTPVSRQPREDGTADETAQRKDEVKPDDKSTPLLQNVPAQSRRPEIELEVLKKLNDDINSPDQAATAETASSAAGIDEEFNIFAPDNESDTVNMPGKDVFGSGINELASAYPAYKEKPEPGSNDDLDYKILEELNEKISRLEDKEEVVRNSIIEPANTEKIEKPEIPHKPSIVKKEPSRAGDKDRKIYIFLMIFLIIICALILAYGILSAGPGESKINVRKETIEEEKQAIIPPQSLQADGLVYSKTDKGFTIQAGSFKSKANADARLSYLNGSGFFPYVFIEEAELEVKGKFYRVKIGFYETIEEARKNAEKIN